MSTRIIIRKKGGDHGGHHGGAWKVAYADFVTAMMALFIVLWLLNTSKAVQEAVGGYFRDPNGTAKLAGSERRGTGENISLKKDDMPQLKEHIEQALKKVSDFEKLKKQVDMTVTNEGLRIELIESEQGTFFESGKAEPSPKGKELLTALATEIGKLPNKTFIEGHTDAKPYVGDRGYTNWELSADRANQARRLMASSGLAPDQVQQVRGFADQQLRNKKDPHDPGNRRISVVVCYQEAPPASASVPQTSAGEVNEQAASEKH